MVRLLLCAVFVLAASGRGGWAQRGASCRDGIGGGAGGGPCLCDAGVVAPTVLNCSQYTPSAGFLALLKRDASSGVISLDRVDAVSSGGNVTVRTLVADATAASSIPPGRRMFLSDALGASRDHVVFVIVDLLSGEQELLFHALYTPGSLVAFPFAPGAAPSRATASLVSLQIDTARTSQSVLELVAVLADRAVLKIVCPLNASGLPTGCSANPSLLTTLAEDPSPGGLSALNAGARQLHVIGTDPAATLPSDPPVLLTINLDSGSTTRVTLSNLAQIAFITSLPETPTNARVVVGGVDSSGNYAAQVVLPSSSGVTLVQRSLLSSPLLIRLNGGFSVGQDWLDPISATADEGTLIAFTRRGVEPVLSVRSANLSATSGVSLTTLTSIGKTTQIIAAGMGLATDCDGIARAILGGNRLYDACGVCGGGTLNRSLCPSGNPSTAGPVTTGAFSATSTTSGTSATPSTASGTGSTTASGGGKEVVSSSQADLTAIIIVVALVFAVALCVLVTAAFIWHRRRSSRSRSGSSSSSSTDEDNQQEMSVEAEVSVRSGDGPKTPEQKRSERRSNQEHYDPAPSSGSKDQRGRVGRDSRDDAWWQIKMGDVTLGKPLGAGAFGQVYRGSYKGNDVAVKTLHGGDELTEEQLEEFRHEGALMLHIPEHDNVIRIYGIAVDVDQRMALVVEFVGLGALKDRLDEPDFAISTRQTIGIAYDIAAGMQHIHNAKVLHNDLSARNVLIQWRDKSEELFLCKVADFGLSKATTQEETKSNMTSGPLKWMAPESLTKRIFSKKSDVYSYGVTVWEACARTDPYPTLDNTTAATKVMSEGLRLTPPDNTPPKLEELMGLCWEEDPSDRPAFGDIMVMLGELRTEVEENPFYQ